MLFKVTKCCQRGGKKNNKKTQKSDLATPNWVIIWEVVTVNRCVYVCVCLLWAHSVLNGVHLSWQSFTLAPDCWQYEPAKLARDLISESPHVTVLCKVIWQDWCKYGVLLVFILNGIPVFHFLSTSLNYCGISASTTVMSCIQMEYLKQEQKILKETNLFFWGGGEFGKAMHSTTCVMNMTQLCSPSYRMWILNLALNGRIWA